MSAYILYIYLSEKPDIFRCVCSNRDKLYYYECRYSDYFWDSVCDTLCTYQELMTPIVGPLVSKTLERLSTAMGTPIAPAPSGGAAAAPPTTPAAEHVAKKPEIKVKPAAPADNGAAVPPPEAKKATNKVYVNAS